MLVLLLAGLLCASAALPEHEHRHAHAHRRRSRARAPAAAPRSGAHHAEHLEHPAGSAAASGGALERGGGAWEEGGFEEEEEDDSAAEPPRQLCRGREQVAPRHPPAVVQLPEFCLSAFSPGRPLRIVSLLWGGQAGKSVNNCKHAGRCCDCGGLYSLILLYPACVCAPGARQTRLGPDQAVRGQVPVLTGEWVDHADANHTGLYDPAAQCPEFAKDFVCGQPYEPARPDPGLYAREFRKVFRPRECELRPWDAAGFERCLAGRRLVMVGDSLMRQTFTVRARAAARAGWGEAGRRGRCAERGLACS